MPSDLCTAQLLFQLLCWTESLRQCPLHRCCRTTWTTRSKRRPTCSAQHHLPTHDISWAKVRVQLHLPPLRSLDLLISPGTAKVTVTCCSPLVHALSNQAGAFHLEMSPKYFTIAVISRHSPLPRRPLRFSLNDVKLNERRNSLIYTARFEYQPKWCTSYSAVWLLHV